MESLVTIVCIVVFGLIGVAGYFEEKHLQPDELIEDTAHQLTQTEREQATAPQGATPEQFADRFNDIFD